jgi:hypothetical protein
VDEVCYIKLRFTGSGVVKCFSNKLINLFSVLFACFDLQHGRPLYGDVFGILQQDEPNYDVCITSYSFCIFSLVRVI